MTLSESIRPDPDEWEDPIVAEVRAIREQLLEEAGGTLDGLVAMLRANEQKRTNLVSLPSKRPEPENGVA